MRKLKKYKPTKFMAKTSHYDKDAADYAVMFIESLCHTKGTWAGKPFELIDWQEQIIRDLFGVLKPNGYRQFNTAYIEIPKKQGKSELAAAVALLLLCGDGEERAEVYGCAADRNQAKIVFDVAVDMVRFCPALSKRVKILESQKKITYLPTNSSYQVLSADVANKHGFNTHGVIFDELHTQPNRKLFDVMLQGSGDARMQPLYFLITTAGNDTNSICYEVHQKAIDIAEGRKVDPTFYSVIYGAAEDEDWTDPKVWKKANPSLGITVGIDKVKAACESAQQNRCQRQRPEQFGQPEYERRHQQDVGRKGRDEEEYECAGEGAFGGVGIHGCELLFDGGFFDLTLDLVVFVADFPCFAVYEIFDLSPHFGSRLRGSQQGNDRAEHHTAQHREKTRTFHSGKMYLKFTRYDCKVQTKSVTCSIIPARSGRTEWIDRGNIRRHLPDIDATTASATTHCVPSCGSCTAGVSVCFGAAWPWDSTSRPPRRCSPCAGNCPDCGSAAPFLSPGRRIVFRRRIASDICGFSIGRTRWRRSLRVMNRVVTCAATSLWWSGRPPSWHGSTAAREGRAIPGIMRGAARRSGSTCGATVNRNFSEALRPLFCGYRVNFGTDRPKCLNSFRLRLRYSRSA